MRDIVDKVEDVTVQVTSEPGICKDRNVQVKITTPDGVYRQQVEMTEGEVTWVEIPLKLVNGCVVTG